MQAPGQYWPLRWPTDLLGTIVPDPADGDPGDVATTDGVTATYQPIPRQVPVPTALTDGQLATVRTGAWIASSVHLSFTETALGRGAWVAGPGCTNSADFHYATDGNLGLSNYWGTVALQAVGHVFSMDMGSTQIFGKVTLYVGNSVGTEASPATIKVEHSLNGSTWTTAFAALAGVATTISILFGGNISARYVRCTIVTVNPPTPTEQWKVNEVNAYLITSAVIGILPTGGVAADVLTKVNGTDYNAIWSAPAIPKLDDLAAPDDNTDLNASTSAHGLQAKFPGNTATFQRADGAYSNELTGLVKATGLMVGTLRVVGEQGAAVADATDAASVILQLNALLARLRTHGLIASSQNFLAEEGLMPPYPQAEESVAFVQYADEVRQT